MTPRRLLHASAQPPPEAVRRSRWWGDPVGELGWTTELARLVRDPVFRGEGVPAGDGTAVLVVPGLGAGDTSSWILRGWLGRIGYAPSAAGIVANIDCSDRVFQRLRTRVGALARADEQPLAIVGHSRGGLLARALAADLPEAVGTVVTLGAALADPYATSAPLQAVIGGLRAYHSAVTDRRQRRGCLTSHCDCDYTRAFTAPLPASVRLTSICARNDGVIRRGACVVADAHNVEVAGRHTGLAFSAAAYRAIAFALAGQRDPAIAPDLRVVDPQPRT